MMMARMMILLLLMMMMMIPLLSLCPGGPLQADNDKNHLEDYLRSMIEARTAAMQQGGPQRHGAPNAVVWPQEPPPGIRLQGHRAFTESCGVCEPAAAAASALPQTTPLLLVS